MQGTTGNENLFVRIFSFFIYANIFLALNVTSLVFETYYILFNRITDPEYPFFLFSSTLTLYCFHRLYRFNFRSGDEQLAMRHRWLIRNRLLFFTVLGCAVMGVVYSLVFFVTPRTVLYLLPVGFISFGYTVPFIPFKGQLLRLRDIPGIKIFLISLVLGLTTVLLPLLEHSRLRDLERPEILFMFIRRMLFIFAITLPFDIRDMDYDAANGTRTIPVKLGVDRAKLLAVLALAVFVLLAILQYFLLPGTNVWYVFALGISGGISALLVMLTQKGKSEFFFSFFMEGMMLLQCLLVLAAHTL
jgi:4-hydroxybenzoate polyprenyltransferase